MTVNQLIAFAKENKISFDSEIKLADNGASLDGFYYDVKAERGSIEIGLKQDDNHGFGCERCNDGCDACDNYDWDAVE